MKKALVIFLFLAVIFSFGAVYADTGSFIVKFSDGFVPPESLCLEVINGQHNLYLSKSDTFPAEIEKYIEYCEKNEEISFDEPLEKEAKLFAAPEDPKYANQWQLQMINIQAAFDYETYGNGIKVAVIDSGCSEHDDLKANVLTGKNYFTNDTDVTDEHGHGTHVAGIIAAQINGIGICGAAPKAKIIPLKCFQNGTTTTDKIVSGIYDAVDTFGCDIINMSFGLPNDNTAMYGAIKHAIDKGVIVVAAVGNSGGSATYYPAGYDGVIGVASVGQTKVRSNFSQHNSSVLVCAPGETVMSTSNENGYVAMQGTSQATPHVTALAAIALSMDKSITPARFKELIINSCEDLGTAGYDTSYGYGLVKAEKLIDNILKDKTVYVSPVNSSDAGAYVYIENTSEEALNALSLFADFQDEVLTSKSIRSITLESGEGCVINMEGISGNETRYFLWKDFVTLQPLFEKRTLE